MPEPGPRRYMFDRSYPFIDPVSAERAREIYEQAVACPDSELEGTLEEGFSYMSGRTTEGLGVLRCRVYPVRPDDEP
jgi:hypothetical protein